MEQKINNDRQRPGKGQSLLRRDKHLRMRAKANKPLDTFTTNDFLDEELFYNREVNLIHSEFFDGMYHIL